MSNNKFITALKENKNDARKRVLIVAGITVAAVAAAVVLTKIQSQQTDVIFVPVEVAETVADAIPTE